MNPTATAYVPSAVIAGTLARRQATPPVTPSLTAAAPPDRSSEPTLSSSGVSMTAAERLRGLRAATPGASAPPAHRESACIRYTRQELLSLRAAAMEHVARDRRVDHPPFRKIPATFAPLLTLPFAMEYVNVDAVVQLVEHCPQTSPPLSSSMSASAEDARDDSAARRFACAVCAQGGPQPCAAVHALVHRLSRRVLSTTLGAALMQPRLVVESLLRLALVFDAKQSSLRLRLLAERSPLVVHLVEEYLCGEGYHLPLPPVAAHEDWAVLNAMLKFDAVRDNKTRVITDLSKHWRRRRTQFEQFVHFFAFRDARPVRPARNMITQSVKPGMVAMLTGDTTAMYLLHRLGFFTPPDYYWTVFPFLRQALGDGTATYDVVRHLGLYLSAVQPADMYNPVERPSHA
ncbi:hypothetical protein NESM_000850100 [Novymonas esmeraldas]|uniref:Uncharacterized protein n=1 Tax=Novymonas esmeraldas TaxID=1808958 RepID=A0AAW0EZ44_9TRYP